MQGTESVRFTFNDRAQFQYHKFGLMVKSDALSRKNSKIERPKCVVCPYIGDKCRPKPSLLDCKHSRHWDSTSEHTRALDVSARWHKESPREEISNVILTRAEIGRRPVDCEPYGRDEQCAKSPNDKLISHRSRNDQKRRSPFLTGITAKEVSDIVKKAQDAREVLYNQPYENPGPHDFRPLSCKQPFQLRMAITPDPFNIKLKSSVLDPIPQENCREAGTCYSKRQKGFVTRKTPEPYFNGRLLLDNGRYSPAFTAYETYLKRVLLTVQNHNCNITK